MILLIDKTFNQWHNLQTTQPQIAKATQTNLIQKQSRLFYHTILFTSLTNLKSQTGLSKLPKWSEKAKLQN